VLIAGTAPAVSPGYSRSAGSSAIPARKVKEGVVLVAGKRLAVFSIRENKGGSVWVRAGSAFVNKDGSLNLLLDVLPLDGKLHVREAGEKRDGAAPGPKNNGEAAVPAPAAAGAQP
jgi:hypothetical protein